LSTPEATTTAITIQHIIITINLLIDIKASSYLQTPMEAHAVAGGKDPIANTFI
jgi:hypothetical protein